jgi:hypothetical protein
LTATTACGEDRPSVRLSQRPALSSLMGYRLLGRAHRTALRPKPYQRRRQVGILARSHQSGAWQLCNSQLWSPSNDASMS